GVEAEALHADQPDHDLVGEVDEHEEEEEERDPPRALQRSIWQRPIWRRATLHCHFGVYSGSLRPLRQAVAAKKRAPAGALSRVSMPEPSALDVGALALVQRAAGLVARHGGDQLVDVVLALRLLRRLHLEQVHVADDAAVLAQ